MTEITLDQIKKALTISSTKPDGTMGMDNEDIDKCAIDLYNQQLECKIEIQIDPVTKQLGFIQPDIIKSKSTRSFSKVKSQPEETENNEQCTHPLWKWDTGKTYHICCTCGAFFND